MPPSLRRCSWPVLIALLLGCVASGSLVKPTHVIRTPAFHESALRAGGVAVVGLSEGAPSIEPAANAGFGSTLAHMCKSWLPGVPVYGPASLRDADEPALRDFARGDTVSLKTLEDVRARVHGARFLLAAQLLGNAVAQAEAESDDDVQYCTARAVTIRFRLFDLEQGALAYAATHRERKQTCRRNTRFRSRSDQGLGAALVGALLAASTNVLVDAVKGTYPPAPSSLELLARASRDFLSAWPGAEEPPSSG